MLTLPDIQSDAARLLLQRRNARRSFTDWARLCGFEPARHHQYLITRLEAAVRGETAKKKIMVFMPPNSAKSTYSSILFPPWYLAQRENSSILTCSCTTDLAEYWGYRSRGLVQDHGKTLGYGLKDDRSSSKLWMTDNGGLFFCGGVGSGIIGRRADLGLIDDPIGSMEDAYSDRQRDKVWNWYEFDFLSRLNPNAIIILIHQRWHEDDLAGRLLAREREEWEVIEIPMLAKEGDVLGRSPGELLWPERYTEKMLAEARKTPAKWSALYQQDPTPEDGDYFKKHWIENNAYDKSDLPDYSELAIYVASDHACSERESADWNTCIPFGVDSRGVIWVLPDIFWEKCDTLTTAEAMLAYMQKYRIRAWLAEADKIGKSIGPFLRKMMREKGVFCYIEEMRPAKDKQSRAQSIRARMQMNMVRFPRFYPEYNRMVTEFLKFPAGAHDDIIDPLAYGGLYLDSLGTGTALPDIEDTAKYFRGRPLTMKWLKKNDAKQKQARAALMLGN